jgi:energy-coupling factor transporter ATP-binding protein EcfA2
VKIRAIRLKEVGRFREPVALEGLTGGLDVLAGSNELGKSTILKAVKLVLFEQHKSKKTKTVEVLRPYAGGAPLVELEFEIDGKSWRIRKQFLAQASAELKDLQSGRVWRGGDAECELSKLLSGSAGAEHFALLWVEQGDSLKALEPAAMMNGALYAAIEAEVVAVADGGAARIAHAKVKQELAALVTSHNPPRPAGAYKVILDERRDLRQQCQAARDRLARAQARLDHLADLRARAAQLSDPEVVTARLAAANAMRAAFDEALKAREKCRHSEQAQQSQEERLVALRAALESFECRITDLAKLEDEARQDAPAMNEMTRRVADCQARVVECRRSRDEIKASLDTVEGRLKALDLAERAKQAAERLQVARGLAAEHKALAGEIANNCAEEGLVIAVRRENAGLETIKARLSAAAPRVSIVYADGAKSEIRVEGRVLKDGETLNPCKPIALEITGVGVVTVAPGQLESLGEDQSNLAAHEEELRALLKRAGAASIDEAERRLGQRRVLEARLAEASIQLKALAPNGLECLERAHAESFSDVPPIKDMCHVAQADLELRSRELEDELGDAERQLVKMEQEQDQVGKDEAGLSARVHERDRRIEMLSQSLGDQAVRKRELEKLSVAVAEAESGLNAAVRDLAAWREKAPEDARFDGMKADAERAEGALADAERDLIEIRREEAGIEGELKADRAGDVSACLAELEDKLASVETRTQDMADQILALQLLDREFSVATSETRERFAKPVLDRLAPYMSIVFPEARLGFGDGLAPKELHRGDDSEALGNLSKGTQEQLAVLVRLGFGGLLAETASPAPLILDDALVYSDDRRIERMFAALKRAANSHQVLVLTCRESTFAALGGHRIAIGAWQTP